MTTRIVPMNKSLAKCQWPSEVTHKAGSQSKNVQTKEYVNYLHRDVLGISSEIKPWACRSRLVIVVSRTEILKSSFTLHGLLSTLR